MTFDLYAAAVAMLDAAETKARVSALNLSCLSMGSDWLLIHKPHFDFFLGNEPFQNLEVIVDIVRLEYILRVWGRTHETGSLNSVNHLVQICRENFEDLQICLGMKEKLGKNLSSMEYPVTRHFSKRCMKLMPVVKCSASDGESEDDDDDGMLSMCQNCLDSYEKYTAMSLAEKEQEEEEFELPAKIPRSITVTNSKMEVVQVKKEEEQVKINASNFVDALIAPSTASLKPEKAETRLTYDDEEDDGEIFDSKSKGGICKFCGKTYKSIGHLLNHERKVHGVKNGSQNEDKAMETNSAGRPKLYSCEFCGKSFVNKLNCSEHRTTHTKEKLFYCEECGQGFGFMSSYKYHVKIHMRAKGLHTDSRNNSLYQYCEHCGNRYSDKKKLKRHIAVKHQNVNYEKESPRTAEVASKSELSIPDRSLLSNTQNNPGSVTPVSTPGAAVLQPQNSGHPPQQQQQPSQGQIHSQQQQQQQPGLSAPVQVAGVLGAHSAQVGPAQSPPGPAQLQSLPPQGQGGPVHGIPGSSVRFDWASLGFRRSYFF